jgi:molybdopterin-guanine dinucleotide biosynthesis protein A
MTARADFSAFVLTGGKSSRMGIDKAFLPINGRTLLSHAAEIAHGVSASVFLVGDPAKFSGFGQAIPDAFRDCGPLGGIHAALVASPKDLNLVFAVDMPLLTTALLEYLARQADESGATVTVPCAGGCLQPLCAVYRKSFASIAEAALRAGRNKIDPLFALVETRIISEPELQQSGFSATLFRNVNTAEEYRGLFTDQL